MQNYRIMIVDDEIDMREGIMLHVDWQAIGFEVAAVAENGQDALEKAENTEIDVVLTDIKMPFMDGLTLSQILSNNYPGIRIIILSGFDEFEYAKEAIKHNVAEYVLKPINVAELTDVLKRVKEQLDKSIEEKRNIALLTESYQKALPLMKENFITELLWGIVPEDELGRRLSEYGLDINSLLHKNVAVFETGPEPDNGYSIASEFLPFSIKKIIEEHFSGRCSCHVYIGTSFLIAITSWQAANCLREIMIIANEICSACKRVLNVTTTAGVGKVYENAADIHHSFQEARKALEYKNHAGTGRAIYISDMEQADNFPEDFSSQHEEQLLAIIRYGDSETIDLYIKEIFQKSVDYDEWEAKIQALNIFSGIYRVIQRFDLQNERVVKEKMAPFMDGYVDGTDLRSRFTEIALAVNSLIRQKSEKASYSLVDRAKRFMDENYADSQLSVDMVCDYLHVSQSYFSTIFKQETGMSYIQYLTELRLSKAIALLSQTDDKTYIIAGKTGYEDPNYFSYVFKKRFGVAPTKYRQK